MVTSGVGAAVATIQRRAPLSLWTCRGRAVSAESISSDACGSCVLQKEDSCLSPVYPGIGSVVRHPKFLSCRFNDCFSSYTQKSTLWSFRRLRNSRLRHRCHGSVCMVGLFVWMCSRVLPATSSTFPTSPTPSQPRCARTWFSQAAVHAGAISVLYVALFEGDACVAPLSYPRLHGDLV